MSERTPQLSRPGSFWSLFDRLGGWLFFLLFVGMAVVAMLAQNRFMEQYKEKPWIEQFALPKPNYVKRLAIGYDSFAADFLFLRAIQAFGGVFFGGSDSGHRYDAVFNYFDVISELDPHFMEVYSFGNLVMGDEGGRQDLALNYLQKGQNNNWRMYKCWYEAAYIKIWGLKQMDNTARYYVKQAGKSHDAPDWIGRWLQYIDEKSGEYNMAILRWLQSYAQALDNNDKILAKIAQAHFLTTINDWHKKILQDAVDKYAADKGRAADSIDQLAAEGYLPPVKIIDLDLLSKNLDFFQSMGGSIKTNLEPIFDNSFVEKGGPLPNLANLRDPYQLTCVDESTKRVVITETQREQQTAQFLKILRGQIVAYYKEKGQYPPTLNDIPGAKGMVDPYCKGWQYDPKAGVIVSQGRPEL